MHTHIHTYTRNQHLLVELQEQGRMSSLSIRSFVLMIQSLCSFKAYGVDPKSPGMDPKVITIESVPISEYWFRRIFMGTHRRESLYSQIEPPWTYCAHEYGHCYCNGKVRFGDANYNSWSQAMVVTGGISCIQNLFGGSPWTGNQRTCQCATGNPKIVPVEFRKSDVIWRFESACARVHDLLRVRWRRSVRRGE